MNRPDFSKNRIRSNLRKCLYLLAALAAAILIFQAFKWLIAEDYSSLQTPQVILWLQELESSDSPNILRNDKTPVVLADNVPPNERLQFKVKNKIIFTFTNDLNLKIINNTGTEIGLNPNLDGLEVLKGTDWTYVPRKSTLLEAYAILSLSKSETTNSYLLSCFDLKKGHYRAIINYYCLERSIIDTVEFDVVGIF